MSDREMRIIDKLISCGVVALLVFAAVMIAYGVVKLG